MRYVAIVRPRADWPVDEPATQTQTMDIIVEDQAPLATGLVDVRGTPIYRVTDRVIGFRGRA